jgi:hypothetical protein
MIALIATLGGGAYAAKKKKKFRIKPNSIGTAKLKDNAVKARKLAPDERSEAFFSKQESPITLPATTETEVAKLNLPAAGKYQVTAQVSLGGSAATDNVVQCTLKDDGATLTAGNGFTNLAAFQDTVTLTWFSDGGNVTLSCNPAVASEARNRVLAAQRVALVTQQ